MAARSSGPEQPRALRHGRPVRPQVHPERVGVEAGAEVEDGQLLRVRLALQHRVVVRAHLGLREVDLPGLQRQQLRILVGHDLERQPVEQRQLSGRARPSSSSAGSARRPAAGPAGRPSATNGPRPTISDGGVAEVPRLGERAGVQRRLQLVARQDGKVVEQPDARAERPTGSARPPWMRPARSRPAASRRRGSTRRESAASSRRRSP